MKSEIFIICFCVLTQLAFVRPHGYLLTPPSRSSIWRHRQFRYQNPPINYNDNELFCGGIHQTDDPGTNCGVCGDQKSSPSPRDNERGGRYYRGIISGRYQAGQTIRVDAVITAPHMGDMTWRLCTDVNRESQQCFNQYLLERADGHGTKVPVRGSGTYTTYLKLPAGMKCNHCVLQWNYRAGNNWGWCPGGGGRLG